MESKKILAIRSMNMAGYLMLKGFVLIRMERNYKSNDNRNVFIFHDTEELSKCMEMYLNKKNEINQLIKN